MLPSPLTILLKDQVNLIIVGAAAWTRRVFIHNDASTYRNQFLNNQITILPPGFSLDPAALDRTGTTQITSPGVPTPTPPVQNVQDVTPGPAMTLRSRTILDDVASAIPPHIWDKPRTRVEFWDQTTVGKVIAALVLTLTSGSATAVVPNNAILTVGQAVTGTNIPINTIILEVPADAQTSVVLSNKATGSGDTIAALTGSNYLGGYFEDEAIGDGDDAVILS
jgi:hypothetical protein